MSRSQAAAAALARDLPRALLKRLPAWRGVLILNYHRIGTPAAPWNRHLWSASEEELDGQLGFLARHAEVVGPRDLPKLATARRGRYAMVTFDDGYRDNHELAYPLLRRHGIAATFFLTSGFLDESRVAWWDELAWMVRHAEHDVLPAGAWLPADLPLHGAQAERTIDVLTERYKTLLGERAQEFLDHVARGTGAGRCDPAAAADAWMTWEMARELRDGGMTIGGHTVTHPVLTRLPVAEQRREVVGCARRLEAELGEPMRWFSYPVGSRSSFTPDTRAVLRDEGVELAFSFYGGHARFGRWDPLDIPRVYVGPGLDRAMLHAMVRLPGVFARPDDDAAARFD